MKQAMIFNIQRFSVYDGPGVRTTVFFKGCNLRCLWCHNPESLSGQKQIGFSAEKCIGCGNCFAVCKERAHFLDVHGIHRLDKEKCKKCFLCTDNCYANALTCIGELYSVDELMEEIRSDKIYFENCVHGGGVTFSGGECMLQDDFLVEILKRCKEEGIHTAIDTAGNVPYERFAKINPYTDIYLYDVKAFDEEVHKKLTGVSNVRILRNLIKLKEEGKDILIRIPVVPGANDMEIEAIAQFLAEHEIHKVELLPYHSMGNAKTELLMEEKRKKFVEPDRVFMEKMADICQIYGIKPQIR